MSLKSKCRKKICMTEIYFRILLNEYKKGYIRF